MKLPNFHHYLKYKNGEIYWRVQMMGRARGVGEWAGTISCGRRLVMINRKNWQVHRVIFWMHYGYMPTLIDHKDGNPLNNKISNLRPSTVKQNSFNMKLSVRNRSGVKGVDWYAAYGKWRVRVSTPEQTGRTFGYYWTLEEARKAADAARRKYHGEFARHA